MKTIGLIGGMSWGSTLEYYRIINEESKKRLGEDHSGELVIYSFDFYDIVGLQEQSEWDELEDMMVEAGNGLKGAGAELLLICANTMNKLAEDVEKRVGLPLLHIGDATAEAIKERKVEKVALLGTKYVMEEDFYREKLEGEYGLELMIPAGEQREKVHDIIYKELCKGIVKKDSKETLLDMIDDLIQEGAEGIILGCTELPMHLDQEEIEVPLFNTTKIHSEAAVDRALSD
ncbi:MAG: aspartate/glutamate racemase family protein [Candidatus Natronoplasma sp.]